MKKLHLRIPGPTEVKKVLDAMQKPMVGHRGKEFEQLFQEVSEGLKKVFQTKNDVLIFPAAGTGALEAAIVNFFSPGDKIVCFTCGVFGDRFAKIAETFGADVERVAVEWGKPITSDIVRERLAKDKNNEIKGVLFTHNETSTGVLNDIKALREAVGDHPALTLVDAVSSLGGADIKTDEWNLDVVVTGAQKALMLPPGLGFISISPKAWEAAKNSKMPKFYWDFLDAKKRLEKWQTPYTPAVSLIFALKESLKIIENEGLDNIFQRHLKLSKALREGLKALGLKPFVEDEFASPTVTAVDISECEVDVKKLLKKQFNMDIAGGQSKLKGKIVRIGHLGYVDELDIIDVLAAIEMVMKDDKLYGVGKRCSKVFARKVIFNESTDQ